MSFAPAELQKITDAGNALAAAALATTEQWATGEAGLILGRWAAGVKVPTELAATIRARGRTNKDIGISRSQNQSFGDNPFQISVATGGRGGIAGQVWTRHPKTKRTVADGWQIAGTISDKGEWAPAWIHFKADLWAKISRGAELFAARLPDTIKRAIAARGLARQSILQMGDAVGINVDTAPGSTLSPADAAVARCAVASDGRTYQNGFGTRTKTAISFELDMVNRYPRIGPAKMAGALSAVLVDRVYSATRVLSQRIFASQEEVARRYPYLEISRS